MTTTKDVDLKAGVRVKDTRKCDYGEGVIEPDEHVPATEYHPKLWHVRWDDPGLDDELMWANELEVINDTV